MQYVLDRQPELESLILCGSPASMIRWVKDCDELLAAEPAEVRAGHPRARGGGVHRLPGVPGGHPRLLPGARLPPVPVARRPGALVRRGRLRRVQHDERPERVHGDRNAEDLGHHGPPAARSRCRRCWSAAGTTSAGRATWRRCTGASPGRSSRSSRTRPTSASPSSRTSSPRLVNAFLDAPGGRLMRRSGDRARPTTAARTSCSTASRRPWWSSASTARPSCGSPTARRPSWPAQADPSDPAVGARAAAAAASCFRSRPDRPGEPSAAWAGRRFAVGQRGRRPGVPGRALDQHAATTSGSGLRPGTLTVGAREVPLGPGTTVVQRARRTTGGTRVPSPASWSAC